MSRSTSARGRRPIWCAALLRAVLILCSFRVIPAVSGAPNAISLLSQNGFLVGSIDTNLTPTSAMTDAQKRALSFFIDQPATIIDRNQTVSLNLGDVLHVGTSVALGTAAPS